MHLHSSSLFSLSFLLLLGIESAGSAEFSQLEWANPGQAGSSLWIRNPRDHAVALDTLYLRNLGFQSYREVALNAGTRRVVYSVEKNRAGKWARLIPQPGKRLWVRARDSLMLTGLECGSRLATGPKAKQAAEDFVVELKLIDNWGDSAKVKATQLATRYYIQDNPGMADSGPKDE